MKKTLTWITWLSISAISPVALAVGLGQASVSSYLNAPLDASMPLLESSDYALSDIRVSVAEPSDFAALGLEWTPLAASVRAQVQEQQGRRQIRLRSEQTMEEPWLELLLTIEYPGGQQSHEVTMLFDPQDYAQQPQNQSQRPFQSQASQSQLSPAQAQATSATQPQVSENINANRSAGNNSAYVGSGDTLWGVAERIKPPEASVQQMMVALLEENPAVFPSGNIHDMRAGQTLRVPDSERVLARSNADTASAIQAMNEAWRARRNGSLQAVPLPAVDTPESETLPTEAASLGPQISDISIETALVLHTSEPDATSESDASNQISALAAGGLEEDEPEALTRAELTEQLRLSQATLQQVLEERELMRAELNELRGDVASLTQALSEALAAQERPQAPLVASMSETDNQGGSGLIARYQWPLALAAIALLVGLLVWLRKRREETWEDVPLTEPVIRPAVSPNVTPGLGGESTGVPITRREERDDSEVAQKQPAESEPLSAQQSERESVFPEEVNDIAFSASALMHAEQDLADKPMHRSLNEEDLSYEKSQAAGLAEQGRQRRQGLQLVALSVTDDVSLAPPPSPLPMRRMLAAMAADSPSDESRAPDTLAAETESPTHILKEADRNFIDYHPPILSTIPSSRDQARSETPMQPTVEFASDNFPLPEIAAKKPRRPIEEEWEIEEVAFKPRGLDNSEPSKSSK